MNPHGIPLVSQDGQQQPKAGGVHNRIIHSLEIDTILLYITLTNKPSFVLNEVPISIKLL